MWESICYSIFALAMLASIVLGFLVFARKKKSLRLFFWCALAFGFGVEFLSTGPKQGVVGVVMGLVFIVPSVCLMVMRVRKFSRTTTQYQESATGVPTTSVNASVPTSPTPVNAPTPTPPISVNAPAPTPPTSVNAAKPTSPTPREDQTKSKADLVVPSWKDGCKKQYSYTVKLHLTNKAKLVEQAMAKEFMLEPVLVGNEVHVLSGGADVGILLERCDMVKDWLKRGDPYFLCVQSLMDDDTSTCTALLVFYRDRRKGQEHREQTVVSLVGYKSAEVQNNICLLHEGEELKIEEGDEREGQMNVTVDGLFLGRLPTKIVKRYEEDDVYGVFFEGTEDEETSKGNVDKPLVRIIW